MSLDELKQLLFDHHVYPAWQFIIYTEKNLSAVNFCLSVLENLVSKIDEQTENWHDEVFHSQSSKEEKVRRIAIGPNNLPKYQMEVLGVPINPWFYYDLKIRDFFQYCMNSLDSMSQVANAALLANKGKKIDSVDFQLLARAFSQQTYSADFPQTASWFESLKNSPEYKYIEAVNNRTKHTGEISNKLAADLLSGGHHADIGSFYRKEQQHDKEDLMTKLNEIQQFLDSSWSDFLQCVSSEVLLDKYVSDRLYSIDGVYQQVLKDDPSNNVSYAYLLSSDFNKMPDKIYLLLGKISDDEIEVKDSPFETILVGSGDPSKEPLEILGRYKAVTSIGKDSLCRFRAYEKDKETNGLLCYAEQVKKTKEFYRFNQFFDIYAVSDDDTFIARCQLPF